jgi:glycosyltransferase involved in cell wall biosynthesis
VTIAWFSPLPPSQSGIAAYSAELIPLLRGRGHLIDAYTENNARDFVWKHRRNPYDLTVFQMGNAACHDYMWAYLFRYRGMVVLHDAQLHQARALFLTRRWKPRRDDYLAEFRANHPDAPADVGELIAAGLGGSLYQHWPLIRLVLESARLAVVHNRRLAEELRDRYPTARVEAIAMGVADPAATSVLRGDLRPAPQPPSSAGTSVLPGDLRPGPQPPSSTATSVLRGDLRIRHGIPVDAIVLAAYGGVTPEKRIGPLVRALSAIADRHPLLHLMLVGSQAEHYDVGAEARRWGVAERVHMTGYVADAELPGYLETADLCASLRWPSNRETSASWLRCLAAGRATLITDLAHLGDVPALDPRGWRLLNADLVAPDDPARAPGDGVAREPVAVSIDILDEDHSLQLALERLAADPALRARLSQAARRWWEAHHQLDAMADSYERVLAAAKASPIPTIDLPAHLHDDAASHVRALVEKFGVAGRLADVLSD